MTRRLAWTICAITFGLLGAGTALGLQTRDNAAVLPLMRFSWWEALLPIQAVGWSVAGAVILARHPGHRIGWLACLTGFSGSLLLFSQSYAAYGLFVRPGSLPAANWMAWVRGWSWYPLACLFLIWLPLLVPDGELPSPRWSWLVWPTAAAVLVYIAAVTVGSDVILGTPSLLLAGRVSHRFLKAAEAITGMFQLVGGSLAVVGLSQRYRRSSQEIRQQLKWFLGAAALVMVVFLAGVPAVLISGVAPYRAPIVEILAPLALACLPLAIWVAVLQHRLYDVNLVLSRTVVYATLGALITATYLLLVVGVGLIIGTGGRPNLVLSIVATAVVALAFQPLRERMQRLVNRLVYGRRLSSYEILADLSSAIARAGSADEVLATIAEAAAKAVGAARSRLRHRRAGGRERVADWPTSGRGEPLVEAVEISHEGEVVGMLEFSRPIGRELTAPEHRLIEAIARQAALALNTLRLSDELANRLEQIEDQAEALAASRARIVQAQESERRRIERDIHDGAQQQMIALIAKLGLAGNQLRRDPRVAGATLQEAQQEARQALTDLRELARGIHPAVLGSKGLVDALETVAARIPIGVRLQTDHAMRQIRYVQEIEGAAYFVACEGLANVLKHAAAPLS